MIKKIFIGSSVFLALIMTVAGYADEHFPFLASVSKDSVNVRSGPNTNFEKIGKVIKGTSIVVLGRSYEWYKVQLLPAMKVYVRSDYLQMTHGQSVAVVVGNNVNVRMAFNSQASSLGEIQKGTLVKVLGEDHGWMVLMPMPGIAAWIHQDFLKEIATDVPPALWIAPLKRNQEPLFSKSFNKASSGVSLATTVVMRGTIEALVDPLEKDVHYEIVLDNKSIFYLQDMPHIDFFCNTVVDVEGFVRPDTDKKYMYPVVRINKIALVL